VCCLKSKQTTVMVSYFWFSAENVFKPSKNKCLSKIFNIMKTVTSFWILVSTDANIFHGSSHSFYCGFYI